MKRTLAIIAAGTALHALLIAAPLAMVEPALPVRQNVRLLALLALANGFFGVELLAMRHANRRAERLLDATDERLHRWSRVSGLLVLAVFWLAVTAAAHCSAGGEATIFAGAATMLAGAALRGGAIRQLGARFVTSSVRGGDPPFVREGVYAWMRHPSETGLLLTVVGAATLAESVSAGMLVALGVLPATLARVRLEERGLQAAFGGEFQAYRRRVRTLIPFVF